MDERSIPFPGDDCIWFDNRIDASLVKVEGAAFVAHDLACGYLI
jgi:hypothetical protein